MRRPRPVPCPHYNPNLQRHGAALLIVLAMLLLIGVLIVGFLSRSVAFRKASANDYAAGNSRKLSEMAVNLVQAQIDHATTSSGTGGQPRTSWVSQPGALRLYNDSGALQRIYRLYSAETFTTSDANDLASDLPPADWDKQSARWIDLNAPASIVAASGTAWRFPILDPRDPNAPNDFTKTNPVEGFGIAPSAPVKAWQPAPMPVRWLYVLKEGQIVAPEVGTGSVLSFAGPTQPSQNNPIVGRIAFWTDDETCKVNVNTAAGTSSTRGSAGIFWDTPRFSAKDEWNFGMIQPRAKEYQRYPGHPATTTLGKVFPDLTSQELLALTPRYTFGGSADATASGTTALTPKPSERLYPSVGELFFDKGRNLAPLDQQRLESSRFLLSANNRSPELTLYGTPRVSIWPVHSDTNKRTATDNLLAFVARTGTGSTAANYSFERKDPTSTTVDISLPRNASLLDYLDTLTSGALGKIPGFGGSFSDKYPENARRDILVKIFDYIRCTNLRDSNFSYANKAKCYAYEGMVTPARHSGWNVQGFGRQPMVSEVSLWLVALGSGTNTKGGTPTGPIPLHKDQVGDRLLLNDTSYWIDHVSTSGTVKVPANNRVAIQAYIVVSYFNPSPGTPQGTLASPALVLGGSLKLEDAGVQLELFNKNNLGCASPWPFTHREDTGMFHGSYSFRTSLYNNADTVDKNGDYTNILLGQPATVETAYYPFYTNILSVSGGTLRLSGSLTLDLYDRSVKGMASNNLPAEKKFCSIPLDFNAFSSFSMPCPSGTSPSSFGLPYTISSATKTSAAVNDRCLLMEKSTKTAVQAGDVFWSLVTNVNDASVAGDYRMLSKPVLSGSAFVPHNALLASATTKAFSAHPLSATVPIAYATIGGRLVRDANYPNGSRTILPAGINGVYARSDSGNSSIPGDWDNGIGAAPDGPYINKADEGTTYLNVNAENPYFSVSLAWAGSTADNYYGALGESCFSPNRMMPGAAMFGSLPTGVQAGRPWQTLLFRPGPTGHLGSQSPKDHLLLDLFWMPVAEPYAISEPFSTNGKANLNYQIQPFTYIQRSTALLSVLDSERVAKLGSGDAQKYKGALRRSADLASLGLGSKSTRLPLNLSATDGTLRQFEEKFAANELFKSASEICDIYLVPQGSQWSTDNAAQAAWYGDDFALVGDNVRERPYANLLGRVTTKSNTFTVYYTVQALKNPPSAPQNQWDESRGVVLSALRGSTTLERYIDPNRLIPDYGAMTAAQLRAAPNLDFYYNWRVIHNSQFAP